jgi:hypothetical protein
VSLPPAGSASPGSGDYPALSVSGRFVAFISGSSNLVGGDTNRQADVFVRDLATGANERVSVDSTGGQASAPPHKIAISGDGRFVAFDTVAPLVGEDTDSYGDVYVRDRQAGTTERVSRVAEGRPRLVGRLGRPRRRL